MGAFRFTYALDLFQGDAARARSRIALQKMLDLLTSLDEDYLREHPEAPLLYRSGIHYMEEPSGQEEWQDVPTLLRMGVGDCEDLATWRAAELRARYNIPARAIYKEMRRANGSYLYHILVQWPP